MIDGPMSNCDQHSLIGWFDTGRYEGRYPPGNVPPKEGITWSHALTAQGDLNGS